MGKEKFLKLIIMFIGVHHMKLEDLNVRMDGRDMLSLYKGDEGLFILVESDERKASVKYLEYTLLLHELKHMI